MLEGFSLPHVALCHIASYCLIFSFAYCLLQIRPTNTEILSRAFDGHALLQNFREEFDAVERLSPIHDPVTVCVHEVKTLVGKKKKKNRETRAVHVHMEILPVVVSEVYVLSVDGKLPNIALPETFKYDDALNSWTSKKFVIENSMVLLDANRMSWRYID